MRSLLVLIFIAGFTVCAIAATIKSAPTTVTVYSTTGLSELAKVAASMVPGEWKELNTNGFGGGSILLPNYAGTGGESPFIEFSDEMKWNPVAKKLIVAGCARGNIGPGDTAAYVCGNSAAEDAGFIEYNEVTNTWSRVLTAPLNTAPHGYDNAALNPLNGDYFFIQSFQINPNKLWKFSGGTWSNLPIPSGAFSMTGALEYFPDRNALIYISGGTDALGDEAVYTYSFATSAWTSTPIGHPVGNYSHFTEYSAKHKLMYFGGSEAVSKTLLKMDAAGNITRGADAPINLGIGGVAGRQCADPVSGNLLLFQTANTTDRSGRIYSYDPTLNVWQTHGTHPLSTQVDSTTWSQISIFAPIPEYGVIIAIKWAGAAGSKVYLYKHQ